jgi:hypothetical protein
MAEVRACKALPQRAGANVAHRSVIQITARAFALVLSRNSLVADNRIASGLEALGSKIPPKARATGEDDEDLATFCLPHLPQGAELEQNVDNGWKITIMASSSAG